jgi:hypothetical protein
MVVPKSGDGEISPSGTRIRRRDMSRRGDDNDFWPMIPERWPKTLIASRAKHYWAGYATQKIVPLPEAWVGSASPSVRQRRGNRVWQ